MSFVFNKLSVCVHVILFSVVGEFGRIALEFLRRGTSPKIYEGAASKTLHLLLHTKQPTPTTATSIS